jgi:hypothetical protein
MPKKQLSQCRRTKLLAGLCPSVSSASPEQKTRSQLLTTGFFVLSPDKQTNMKFLLVLLVLHWLLNRFRKRAEQNN